MAPHRPPARTRAGAVLVCALTALMALLTASPALAGSDTHRIRATRATCSIVEITNARLQRSSAAWRRFFAANPDDCRLMAEFYDHLSSRSSTKAEARAYARWYFVGVAARDVNPVDGDGLARPRVARQAVASYRRFLRLRAAA